MRALTLVVLGLVCVSASAATDSVLDATVHYRGQGTVDDRHPLVALLFDGPNLGQPPTRLIAARVLFENGATASFDELAADPVYLAVLYDLHGGLSGLNIPVGTPFSTYRTEESPAPSPIQPGPGTRVEVSFDDSELFPGKPGGDEPLEVLRAADRGVVEVRMYTIKEGRREEFVKFFEERTLAPQVGTGMRMLGQFRSLEDENLFVWIRSFPSQEERVRQLREFYMGKTWLEDLGKGAGDLIEATEVLLVEPTVRSVMR